MSWVERYGVHTLHLPVSAQIQVTWRGKGYQVNVGGYWLSESYPSVAAAKQAGLEYVRQQLTQALDQVNALLGPAEGG